MEAFQCLGTDDPWDVAVASFMKTGELFDIKAKTRNHQAQVVIKASLLNEIAAALGCSSHLPMYATPVPTEVKRQERLKPFLNAAGSWHTAIGPIQKHIESLQPESESPFIGDGPTGEAAAAVMSLQLVYAARQKYKASDAAKAEGHLLLVAAMLDWHSKVLSPRHFCIACTQNSPQHHHPFPHNFKAYAKEMKMSVFS